MIREDEDTVRALRGALATAVRDHHLDPRVAEPAVARLEADPPRRWSVREYLAVAAACAVVAGSASGIYAATSSRSHPRTAAASPGSACTGVISTTPLPEWARAGFSTPDAPVAHIMSSGGQIVAILFVNPLHAPAVPDPSNKILWVSRDFGAGPLTIQARLEGSNRTATRSVADGPGPSIIDMPVAGCWQMTLTWSGHTDTIAIPYEP